MPITICVLLSAFPGREQSLARYEDQVLEFESERSLAQFQDDPRRLALSELREESIASTTVTRVQPIG